MWVQIPPETLEFFHMKKLSMELASGKSVILLGCLHVPEIIQEGTCDVFLPLKTCDLKRVQLYLTKCSERESLSIKMCCINIHLKIDQFTFNKYCICKWLYMVLHTFRIKCCTTKFVYVFACIHRTHPKFSNENYVV